jgi:hypothetical protein
MRVIICVIINILVFAPVFDALEARLFCGVVSFYVGLNLLCRVVVCSDP